MFQMMKTKPHKVCSTVASILFRKNFAVQQVKRGGKWVSPTLFTSFYLREVTRRSMDSYFTGACGNFKHLAFISCGNSCSIILFRVASYNRLCWVVNAIPLNVY